MNKDLEDRTMEISQSESRKKKKLIKIKAIEEITQITFSIPIFIF